GLALSGHMDTVPDTGWQTDPWSGRIDNGVLHGLGSTDMKGPVAAAIVAARALPDGVPITRVIGTLSGNARAATMAAATGPFMSVLPRPCSTPLSMRPDHGSVCQPVSGT